MKRSGSKYYRADNERVRVLILTIAFGGGHESVGLALSDEVRDSIQNADVTIMDPLSLVPLMRLQYIGAAWYRLITSPPFRPIYKWIYAITDRWPWITAGATRIVLGRWFHRYCAVSEPDVIVSTFPHIGSCIYHTIQRLNRTIPFITVVTDGGPVHGAWFTGHSDRLVVHDETVAARAHEFGVTATRIHVLGTPLRRQFDIRGDRSEARRALELADCPTLLIWGGAQGMAARLGRLIERIDQLQIALQVVVLAGGNSRLRRRLERIETLYCTVKVRGFDSSPARYLFAANIVLGKAGWLSLVEAAQCDRPTLIVDSLPGQEAHNVAAAIEFGWVRVISGDVEAALQQALEREEGIQDRPAGDARRRIGELIVEALSKKEGALVESDGA